MRGDIVKHIANYISITRIVLSVILAFTKPLSIAFLAIYIICGISDALDGYIARRTNTAGRLGEKLDSAADLIMAVVLLVALYQVVNPTIQILAWIAVIVIIRAGSMLVVFIKYKTFAILHTYGNKITGLLLFAFPLSLAFVKEDMPMYIVCSAASISAVEELLIDLSSKELQANRKSIFSK